MTDSRHLHHRRAFGHRAREPQSGFSPTAIFGLPLPTGLVPPGLISDITQISEYLSPMYMPRVAEIVLSFSSVRCSGYS